MAVYYKFSAEIQDSTFRFDDAYITVRELKEGIVAARGMKKFFKVDFDLDLFNAVNDESKYEILLLHVCAYCSTDVTSR